MLKGRPTGISHGYRSWLYIFCPFIIVWLFILLNWSY